MSKPAKVGPVKIRKETKWKEWRLAARNVLTNKSVPHSIVFTTRRDAAVAKAAMSFPKAWRVVRVEIREERK